MPAGNWQATTKVTLDHDNAWQYAGLVVHVDDNNYTKLTFTRHTDGRRFVEFWSETNGTRTAHGGNASWPPRTRPRSTCGSPTTAGR